MSSLHPTISPVLREAAELKIEEFELLKADFAKIFQNAVGRKGDGEEDRDAVLARLETLLEDIQPWESQVMRDDGLSMWTRRVEQAKNDMSITREKLLCMENDLEEKLRQFMNRFEVSSIHIALLKHGLVRPEGKGNTDTAMSKVAIEDEFELVEDDLESVFAAFEEHAFSEKEIDTNAITKYLTDLYEEAFGKEHLELFRKEMAGYGNAIMEGTDHLDPELLEWCIEDLLANSMLSPERERTLRTFLDSDAAMRELTDTLNVKSIRNWNWRNAQEGLPIVSRKNSDGKHCIVIEEDLIDMLFLHTLSVRWSTQLKKCLTYFDALHPRISHMIPSFEEVAKREYYLHGPRPPPIPNTTSTFHDVPPPPSPPYFDSLPPLPPLKCGRKYRRKCGPPGPPPPPPAAYYKAKKEKTQKYFSLLPSPRRNTSGLCVEGERQRIYSRNFFMTRLPKRDEYSAMKKPAESKMQAELLKMIAMEVKMREAFDGVAHGFAANFGAFASSLPHRTVVAVLEFLGVPEEWIGVFKRFLNAPLNMGPVVRGTKDQVRRRTAGVPIAHGLETFFGEAVLFCLDLAVLHRASTDMASTRLYRLRDRCYFVGKQEQCEAAKKEATLFAKTFGLDLRTKELFSGETIGLLKFSRNGSHHLETSNKVAITIDSAKLTSFAHHVKQRLSTCTSTYQWVSTWNSTVGTYAPHLFGPLIRAFDTPHLDAITHAYRLLHSLILDNQTLPEHLTPFLPPLPTTAPRFPLSAFLHLPPSFGGLGIHTPFSTLTAASSPLAPSSSILKEYLATEHTYYTSISHIFTTLTPAQRSSKLASILSSNTSTSTDIDTVDTTLLTSIFGQDYSTTTAIFPSIQSLITHREARPAPFHDPYTLAGLPLPPSYNAYAIPPPPPPPPPPPGSFAGPGLGFPAYSPPGTLNVSRAPDLLETYRALGGKVDRPDVVVEERVMDEVRRSGTEWWDMGEGSRAVVGLFGGEAIGWAGGLEMGWGEGVPGELIKVVGGEGAGERERRRGDEDGDGGGYWGDVAS